MEYDISVGDRVFKFILNCVACPEQYDVFLDGHKVGYVRLRWGVLTLSYMVPAGLTIYQYIWESEPMKGSFEDDEERDRFFLIMARALNTFISDGVVT